MTTLVAPRVPVTTPLTDPGTGPEEAPVPALSPIGLSGLTAGDLDRVNAALTATIAPATRTVYDCVWGIWERWCRAHALCAMPADPAAICAYLAERADEGVAADTLTQTCSAIAYRHRTHGLADPTLNDAVRQVRRGLRRLIGIAPRRQARPLATTEIRLILDHIDRSTPKGARDAALILLGFASAMRRSELATLDLTDVNHRPGGILITIRRSKTDQDGAGQVVGVASGHRAATDPVAALTAWYAHRGDNPGPVFTSLRTRVVTHDSISDEAISRMLRTRARVAGLDSTRIRGTVVSPKGVATYRQEHPKTSSSVRTVAVPSFAAEALRRRLVVVSGELDDALLFVIRNGTPLTTNNVRRRLRAALE